MIENTIIKIEELKAAYKKANEELKGKIFYIIDSVAKNQPINNKIGKHIRIVNFSEMHGKPWDPDYYIWEHSAKMLKKHLENKSGEECYRYITETLPKTETKINSYEIVTYVTFMGVRFYDKICLNKNFIDNVISKLLV